MSQLRVSLAALIAALAASASLAPAVAAPAIVNGGFESGFAGWTRADQLGSLGSFSLQSGTASPVLADPVPAPPEGSLAAMTDSDGPGAHVLYQDFVAVAGAATLSFQMFRGNRAGDLAAPATLNFNIPQVNQQARVDILRASSDPFSVAAGDILYNLFATTAADLDSGYNTYSTDITALLAAHAGDTLRLRFAVTDNLFAYQLGVDDVRITGANPVPEPGAFALAGLALLGLACSRRHRASAAQAR